MSSSGSYSSWVIDVHQNQGTFSTTPMALAQLNPFSMFISQVYSAEEKVHGGQARIVKRGKLIGKWYTRLREPVVHAFFFLRYQMSHPGFSYYTCGSTKHIISSEKESFFFLK